MTFPSTLPRATVSAVALREGAAAALAAGGRVADLRGDAWGHGAFETARILAQVGVPEVLERLIERVPPPKGDAGAPLVAVEPNSEAARHFTAIAEELLARLEKKQASAQPPSA